MIHSGGSRVDIFRCLYTIQHAHHTPTLGKKNKRNKINFKIHYKKNLKLKN